MSDGDSAEDNSEFHVDMEELVGSVKSLLEHWGQSTYVSHLADKVRDSLLEHFCEGDFASVVAHCRKEDNSVFSAQEINDLDNEFDTCKKTQSFPFCFTEGAVAIKEAFVEHCWSRGLNLGCDVEVGVYFSQAGGAPMPWHMDSNHNITIQLLGEKDWLLAPGTPHVTSSYDLTRTPGNKFEQLFADPQLGRANRQRQRLKPGSVLYVPPGHWHSVIPTSGLSFSIDLRVANVTAAKWQAEVLFARSSRLHRASSVGFSAFVPCLPASAALDDLDEIFKLLPSERSRSDGLEVGASLAHVRKCLDEAADTLPADVEVVTSDLVAMDWLRSDDEVLVRMRAVSSLTTTEFFRFTVACPGVSTVFQEGLEDLAHEGRVQVAAVPDDNFIALISVLAKANIVRVDGPPGAPPRKKPRR